MSKIHHLKTTAEHFNETLAGRKTFEIEKDDRGFEVGDVLRLQLWDPVHGYRSLEGREFSSDPDMGSHFDQVITHKLKGGRYGLAEDHCILSVKPLTQSPGQGARTEQPVNLGVRVAAQELLAACVEDMGYGDEEGDFPDLDDEAVGLGDTGPTAVKFGHMRRLRDELAKEHLTHDYQKLAKALEVASKLHEESYVKDEPVEVYGILHPMGHYEISIDRAASECDPDSRTQQLVSLLLFLAWNDALDWASLVLGPNSLGFKPKTTAPAQPVAPNT